MNFVLIDYKGGAAFRDFAPLPHTVGMVTDLDTHLVERALESRWAPSSVVASTCWPMPAAKDIEDYLDRLGRGEPLPPMPRLLIVIDEFASLVRELPDFVTGLVNIAQRGRSLGIHLILATQRPTGVVSPDIRANTNLRIALRVTDSSESTDVIDAADAAQISEVHPRPRVRPAGRRRAAAVPVRSRRWPSPRTVDPAQRRSGPVPVSWSALGTAPPAPPKSEVQRHRRANRPAGARRRRDRGRSGARRSGSVPSLARCPAGDAALHRPQRPRVGTRRQHRHAMPGCGPLPFALQDFPGEQAQRVRSARPRLRRAPLRRRGPAERPVAGAPDPGGSHRPEHLGGRRPRVRARLRQRRAAADPGTPARRRRRPACPDRTSPAAADQAGPGARPAPAGAG